MNRLNCCRAALAGGVSPFSNSASRSPTRRAWRGGSADSARLRASARPQRQHTSSVMPPLPARRSRTHPRPDVRSRTPLQVPGRKNREALPLKASQNQCPLVPPKRTCFDMASDRQCGARSALIEVAPDRRAQLMSSGDLSRIASAVTPPDACRRAEQWPFSTCRFHHHLHACAPAPLHRTGSATSPAASRSVGRDVSTLSAPGPRP